MVKDILDAVYGCLIAAAIGDALGAPAEGLYFHEIQETYGRLNDLIAYDNVPYSEGHAGAVTDDTTLNYCMCMAVIQKGGRITPEDAAEIWLKHLNPARFWDPDRIAYLKLKAGVNPWTAGRGNIPSACATMAMIPIGIINAADPRQAYQDGFNIAGINGDGLNQEGAATVAAGVAAALARDASVGSIINSMMAVSSPMMNRAIELTLSLAGDDKDVERFKALFYERMLDWWSRPSLRLDIDRLPQGTSIESVPVAIAIFSLCNGDIDRCLVEGANFGRDADAIASIAGAFAGSLRGASAIKRRGLDRNSRTRQSQAF